MEKVQNVPIAGGSLGWGGLYNRGDSIIPSNYSSDLSNVYDSNGILKKRKGYLRKSYGYFILIGSYEETFTGTTVMDATYQKISQEVFLSGAGAGGDLDFTDGTFDFIVAFSLQNNVVYEDINAVLSIYTVDGSGHPDALLASTESLNLSAVGTSEEWVYGYFSSANLTTNNVCIVIEPASTPTGNYKAVHYSDGGGGYAPGGARVSSYYDGAWKDISGTDFKFKFYLLLKNLPNSDYHIKNCFQYFDNSASGIYPGSASMTEDSQNIELTDPTGVEKDSTLFAENEATAYQITNINTALSTEQIILPPLGAATSSKEAFIYKTRLIVATPLYLCQSAFNNCVMRIHKYSTSNTMYGFTNTPGGLVIVCDNNVPQIWGSSSYPISGYTGDMSFAGLTNSITKAKTVMYHENRVWLGNVTIDGTVYSNRIYYSGIGTPESGYSDTGYITTIGANTALLDCGDYAVMSDYNYTYVLLGAVSILTTEVVKHGASGGVVSQDAIALYNNISEDIKVYGFGVKGIFEIKRFKKRYIHNNIIDTINGLINADVFVCPDYNRDYIIFGYAETGTRKTLIYNIVTESWWLENLIIKMINVIHGGFSEAQIYGYFSTQNKVFHMYTGDYDAYISNEQPTAIEAYYKCGPSYANVNSLFGLHKIWTKVRNEPNMSQLDVKYSLDYGSDVEEKEIIKNTGFANNVPIIKQTDCEGSAISTVITVYQNSILTTVSSESVSGQTILNVTSVTGFSVGHKIAINKVGASRELAVVASVGTTSLTLSANLTNTHSATEAVETYDESFAVSEISVDIYGGTKEDQSLDR